MKGTVSIKTYGCGYVEIECDDCNQIIEGERCEICHNSKLRQEDEIRISNIEGLQGYMIGYHKISREHNHYCSAELMYKGYMINLDRVYYPTLDDAVQGLKDRLKKAIADFELKITQHEQRKD